MAGAKLSVLKTCLFVGPTLYRVPPPTAVQRYGPVALGSVFRAVEAGYRRIAIVDGYFGNTPSVWHKEILFAMAEGVEITGAASMGALRAAELSAYGMIGIGRIFRLFRRGVWTDDDEVAVIHATEELDFGPVSEAMANIRFTLRKLRRIGIADAGVESRLIHHMKARHFSERTRSELRDHAARLMGERDAQRLIAHFEREYVDAKQCDAQALIAYLMHRPFVAPPRQAWRFPATAQWIKQFEKDIADVPRLR